MDVLEDGSALLLVWWQATAVKLFATMSPQRLNLSQPRVRRRVAGSVSGCGVRVLGSVATRHGVEPIGAVPLDGSHRRRGPKRRPSDSVGLTGSPLIGQHHHAARDRR